MHTLNPPTQARRVRQLTGLTASTVTALLCLLVGCASTNGKADDIAGTNTNTNTNTSTSTSTSTSPSSPGTAAAPARKPAAARAPTSSASRGNVPAPVPHAPPAPGLNEHGEVVDTSKLAAGSGQKVRGRGGWDGEVMGKPAPGSKLARLEIGMSLREVTELLGPPSDQGVYNTSKSWWPFYLGADRHRYELVYKGQGRLVFAGGSLTDPRGGNLIWIIHNMHEGSTRS